MFATMLAVVIPVCVGWMETPAAWNSSYARAHAEACSNDKPLFVMICSGSSDYARMISLGVFMSDGVERLLTADYVRVLVDTDTPEGRELARRFDVEEGPHFVIIDRSGRWQVYYQSGYLTEDDLAPVLAQCRRIRLTPSGRPIREVASRRQVQLCST